MTTQQSIDQAKTDGESLQYPLRGHTVASHYQAIGYVFRMVIGGTDTHCAPCPKTQLENE